jgi:hypothetical protein
VKPNGRLLGPSYDCAKRVFLPDFARDISQTDSFRCYCTVCAPCRTDRSGRAGIEAEPGTSFVPGIPAIRPRHWLQPIDRDGWASCEQCRHGFWRRDYLCDYTRRPNQGERGITRVLSLVHWALSDVWAIGGGGDRCDRGAPPNQDDPCHLGLSLLPVIGRGKAGFSPEDLGKVARIRVTDFVRDRNHALFGLP